MSFARFNRPDWAVVVPWGTVAVMTAVGGFHLNNLRREIAEIEARNIAVYLEAGRALRRDCAKHGWDKAWTYLEKVVPEIVAIGGPSHEVREVAITALTRQCSSWLPDPCEQSPVFSSNSRWLIQRLANGSIAFTAVGQTDPSTFILTVAADDVHVQGDFIYYSSAKSWWRIHLQSEADGYSALSPAEPTDAPTSAAHASSFVIKPIILGASQKMILQLADGSEIPVHADRKQEPKPYSVAVSPDGQFAALWTEGLWVKVWRLAVLRQHLSKLGLDWTTPAFPKRASLIGSNSYLSGTEELSPRGIHLPIIPLSKSPGISSQNDIASSRNTSYSPPAALRRKVHLPVLPPPKDKTK